MIHRLIILHIYYTDSFPFIGKRVAEEVLEAEMQCVVCGVCVECIVCVLPAPRL